MSTPLTICVANVQAGVGTTKGVLHYFTTMWKYWLPHSDTPLIKVGEMMKHESVNLGFLIEVSGPSLHSGFHSMNDVIAGSAGLSERQFFTEKDPFRITQEGLGIISNFKLTNPKLHPLKRGILTWFLAEATLQIDGRKITLFLAHNGLGPRVRAKQFKQIAEIIKQRSGPIILAGDFNESKEEPFEMLLRETSLKYSYGNKSFPSWKPRHAFDRILLSGEFKVTDHFTPKAEIVSDHLPFIVKAELA